MTGGSGNLGVLYQNGLGLPLDYPEAYKWQALASERGYGPSRKALATLIQVMTEAQVQDGRRRMPWWADQHHTGGGSAGGAQCRRMKSANGDCSSANFANFLPNRAFV